MRAILEDVQNDKARALLNVINLGEIIYTVQRRYGQQKKLDVVIADNGDSLLRAETGLN